MSTQLPKRSVQIPFLKHAALRLAQREGEAILVSGIPVTEVKLSTLYFWLTAFGPSMNLDVWDESTGGNKVLNISWGPDNTIEVVSFRRGEWESVLLRRANIGLH